MVRHALERTLKFTHKLPLRIDSLSIRAELAIQRTNEFEALVNSLFVHSTYFAGVF